MHLFLVAVLFGLTAAVLGAAAACWFCLSRFRVRHEAQTRAEADRAAEVLLRLQDLATRVAFDVDEHASQVEEINDELISATRHEPTVIVGVVAKLIETNQRMHERLATTEGRLREQAQEIQIHAAAARTDALTLLANRRAFDDELAARFAEFGLRGLRFSLIMLDVDRFKEFNDAHGHQTGDAVLRDVAKLLRRKMRDADMVARYGGEEFAIVLPETELDEACRIALRACREIEKSQFRREGKQLQVTASFGVAEVTDDEDGASLVTRADQALYAAKRNGRNCVWRHDGQTAELVNSDPPPAPPSPADPAGDVPVPAEGESPEVASDFASRTGFCKQVRSRTAEWNRGGPTFSVVLLEVNERQQGGGSASLPAGESATIAATGILAAMVREMDIVGCYAPGCFALLLPTAALADALRLAERLREAFLHHAAPGRGGPPRLFASVGAVQIMKTDDSVSLLKRAEAALDAASRRGGNRTFYHDGDRCVPVTAISEPPVHSA